MATEGKHVTTAGELAAVLAADPAAEVCFNVAKGTLCVGARAIPLRKTGMHPEHVKILGEVAKHYGVVDVGKVPGLERFCDKYADTFAEYVSKPHRQGALGYNLWNYLVQHLTDGKMVAPSIGSSRTYVAALNDALAPYRVAHRAY